jgi:CBS domain containing-hemolysin-like protein
VKGPASRFGFLSEIGGLGRPFENDVSTIALQIVLLGFLLFLSFVFSGSETALFSLKSYQVRKLQGRPSHRSITVGSLLKDPYHLLVTILIGNTLVNVAASSIGTNIVHRFVNQGVIGISVAIMTTLILIFGEIIPKTLAVSNPPRMSLAAAPLISRAVRLFSPLKSSLEIAIRAIVRRGSARVQAKLAPFDDHVAEAIALGHSEGALDGFEREMLGGIFRLMHLSVQNIMTPRTEVYMLSSDLTIGEAVALVRSSGYSRIPVFEAGERDTIIGILYTKDLLYTELRPDEDLSELVRKPIFVPESKALVDLLSDFVSGAAHFAVAIDEHGSFIGVVTLDDILGEVIGRDGDRHLEKYRYRRMSKSRWEVSGRMEMEYFNALLGTTLSGVHAETIAGCMIDRMGKIPSVGEEVVIDSLRLKVLAADSRRIIRVEVVKLRK